jgi:hypothetical protein
MAAADLLLSRRWRRRILMLARKLTENQGNSGQLEPGGGELVLGNEDALHCSLVLLT